MAEQFRQSKWGEQIDGVDRHIAYLEQVQKYWSDRPNFRGAELAEARELAILLRSRMKELGKRRDSAFWPNTVYPA